MFAPVGFMTKEEVYKQTKTQKHMEDVGCVSSDLRKKHKNTQNTKGVTLFICPFEAEKKKHKNTQNTKAVAPLLFGPHHTLTKK